MALTIVLGVPALAIAQPEPGSAPALSWVAPAGCPSEQEFRDRVVTTLERSRVQVDADWRFRVEVRPTADRLELVLESEHGVETGTRTLAGTSCDELASAAVVAIVLALQATAVEAPAAPARTYDPADVEAPGVKGTNVSAAFDASPPAPPVRARERRKLGGAAYVLGLGDRGSLPTTAAGVRVGGALRRARLSVGGSLGFVGPSTSPGEQSTARFRLWLAELKGCVRPTSAEAASLDLCALFEAGWLSGAGRAVDVARTAHETWLAPGARLAGTAVLAGTRLRLVVGVVGLAPLRRPEFVVFEPDPQQPTVVHRPAPLVGRLELGVRAELP